MSVSRLTTLAALAATMITLGTAAHADTGLTREQVKAELAQAQRDGTLIDPETGRPLRELFPSAYPAVATKAAKATQATAPATGSLHELPATAAGARAHLPVSGPWDYEAIAQRNAELLQRAGR